MTVETIATGTAKRHHTSRGESRGEQAVIVGTLLIGMAALWSRPTLITLADAPLVLAVLFGGLLALGVTMPVTGSIAGVVDGATAWRDTSARVRSP